MISIQSAAANHAETYMIETPHVLYSVFDISINQFIDLFICNLIYFPDFL